MLSLLTPATSERRHRHLRGARAIRSSARASSHFRHRTCTDASRTWTTTTYDLLGRPTRVDAPDGTASTLAYSGNQITATDPRGHSTVQLRNALGELVSVTDALGTVTAYDTTADGNQSSITRDAGRGQVQNLFAYDARGRKVQQNDPDSGVVALSYNALGELIAQQDAAGNRIEFQLDARGRTWRKTVKRADATVESQATFVFDTAPNGLGQPTSETITGTYSGWVGQSGVAHSFSRGYGYDALGRGITVSTTISGTTYTHATVPDALGRPWKHQDASGGWHKNEYSARGFNAGLCISDAADAALACAGSWQRTQETDVWGNIVREIRATGAQIPIVRSYNPLNGRQTGLCAGTNNCDLVNELYAWDAAGNLSTQQKEGRYAQTFQYDALNRLTHGYLTMRNGLVVNNTLLHWGVYDRLGNVCARMFQGVGTTMGYGGRAGCGADVAYGSGSAGLVGAHRLTVAHAAGGDWLYSWDARGNQTVRDAPGTANDRTIQYSLDDHAHEIVTGNGKRTRYWYGPDGQRYKRQDIDGRITLYVGQVEVLIQGGATTWRRNIQGVLIKTDGAQPMENRFIFTDRLGSVVKYTSGAGVVHQPQDYDEWGQRRDYDDPQLNGVAAPSPTISLRGFTGHEMVDGQDAIHMNARMYDPMLGRFLQADPLIQAPENLQSWNAYTYVFNNPLTLVDPTGMFSWRKFLGVFSQVLNVLAIFFQPLVIYAKLLSGALALASGGLKGGLIGAFGSMIPGFQSVKGIWDNIGNLMISTAVGGASAVIMGGRFKEGAIGALKSAAISMTLGAIAEHSKSRQTGANKNLGRSLKRC